MVTTDPIADMLTRIRNANQQKHETVSIPYSNPVSYTHLTLPTT